MDNGQSIQNDIQIIIVWIEYDNLLEGMRNIQLYEEIKRIVRERNEVQPQSASFAQKYCQQQLVKKKLNPYDPRQKMNHLMKNFKQLETYVDVKALLDIINDRIKDKENQEQQKKYMQSCRSLPKSQNNNNQDCVLRIKRKIKEKLGHKFAEKYQKDNLYLNELIEHMDNTQVSSDTYRNNQLNPNVNNYINQPMPADWTIQNIDHQIINNNNITTRKKQSSNIEERKKYADLIHQVSTYLQIILQSQHRKKWDNNKYQPTIHNNNSCKSVKRTQQFNTTLWLSQRKNRLKNNLKNKQLAQNYSTISQQKSFNRSKVTNSRIEQKSKIFETFTFRNRNIKEGLMNKIKNFINSVEDEEKMFKIENKNHFIQIQKYQNILKVDSSKQSGIFDDQGLKEVRVRALEFK